MPCAHIPEPWQMGQHFIMGVSFMVGFPLCSVGTLTLLTGLKPLGRGRQRGGNEDAQAAQRLTLVGLEPHVQLTNKRIYFFFGQVSPA